MESTLKKVREKSCLSAAVDGDINRHMSNLCIFCDGLIIGFEKVKLIDKLMLLDHSDQLCVLAYEAYYDVFDWARRCWQKYCD